MAERLHHQPADGINFFIAEVGAESVAEVFNRRQRANAAPGMAAKLTEVDIVFFVLGIINFTDNQVEDVFDSYQAGNVAKLIDNDGHMVALGAEFPERYGQLVCFPVRQPRCVTLCPCVEGFRHRCA